VPEGLISSFPVTITNGKVEIVQGLDIDDFSRAKIDASAKELADERDAVKELGLILPLVMVTGKEEMRPSGTP
jgi:malate dehydrogenase